MRPLFPHHKRTSGHQSTPNAIFMQSYMIWCGLLLWSVVFCARGNWSEPSSVPPVAACWSIKPVCTPPWPSLRPVRPPRALTVDKSWVWPIFDACVGVCRVSGVHGLNVPLPLCPPHAHSYHGVYLQSMDPPPPPPPPSSAGPPDNHDERVSGTHRLKSPAPHCHPNLPRPLPPWLILPLFVPLRCHHDHHHDRHHAATPGHRR